MLQLRQLHGAGPEWPHVWGRGWACGALEGRAGARTVVVSVVALAVSRVYAARAPGHPIA